MTKLFDLHEYELPSPLSWTQTDDPNCEEEQQLKQGVGRNTAQNDMAPVHDMVQSGDGKMGSHFSTPLQESQSSANSATIFYGVITLVIVSSLILHIQL